MAERLEIICVSHLGCHIWPMKAVNDKLSDFGSLKGSEDTKLQLHVLAPTGTCSKQFEKKNVCNIRATFSIMHLSDIWRDHRWPYEACCGWIWLRYILSQSYNAAVFCSDNISFLTHALNQLFLQMVQSVKHRFKQSVSNCSRNKPFYGGRVVEKKNEMHADVPVSDMRHAFRASWKMSWFLIFISEFVSFLSDKMFYKCSSLI